MHRGLRCGSYPLARLFQDHCRIVEHPQLEIAGSKQGHVFANRFSRDGTLLEKEQECLRCYPGDQQKAAGRDSQHDERPEMMIIRLPA